MKQVKNTLAIAFPIILGQLGFTLLGFIDNVMVGKLGASSLAAISLSNSFIFIGLAIGIGFSIMITPLVSNALGEKNYDKISKLFYNGLLLCTSLGIVLFLCIWNSKYIIYNSKQSAEVVKLAIPYLEIVALSLIPSMIFQGLKQFIDGLSKTKYPMFCIIIANLINIFLNYALIFGAFGFPKLGVYGAGLGTFISRIIMLALAILFILKIESIRQYIKRLNINELNITTILSVTKTGAFSSIQILFKISLFSAAILLSGILGENFQAANQIILSLSGLLFVVPLGIATASSIRISKMIGEKNKNEIQLISWSSLKIIISLEILFFIILYLCKDLLPLIYINDITVVQMASKAIILLAIFHFFDGIEVVVLGFLKGFNDTKTPATLCFLSYWVIGFSISYFTYESYGMKGIWSGLIIGVLSSTIVLLMRYRNVYNMFLKGGKVMK
ncbi:MATE family efflux transporter [Tenacibaculum sp. C7A-26P2]|uniref:MATE family efflux transporter n=1 Tax=Tenacibaculum sp. C7A-26P2 TaxID=3447504 RepID=UPI003F844454